VKPAQLEYSAVRKLEYSGKTAWDFDDGKTRLSLGVSLNFRFKLDCKIQA
jgi:hypothetical protein